jgi:hypothetical protein
VGNELLRGLRSREAILALLVAVTALLGVQALAAAPASAILTDGNDCPALASCGDAAGGDPNSSPLEAGPSVDDFDASSESEASTEDQIDPLDNDDDEQASPLTDKPSPFFDPPVVYNGDPDKLSSDGWNRAVASGNQIFMWPGAAPMCDSLSRNIARGTDFLYRARERVGALNKKIERLDDNFMRLDAAHPDAASVEHDIEKLKGRVRDLRGRFYDKAEQIEQYEDFYLKKGCDSIYGASADLYWVPPSIGD